MQVLNAVTSEKQDEIKDKLLKLIEAIEERTEEIDYPLYCF
jgi:hypothetical protein